MLFHSDGNILNAMTAKSSTVDLLIGEAEAAFLAISKAKDLHLSNLIFTGDSVLVVDSLHLASLSLLMP